ncbi:hypothetical protein [Streptomyces sp. RB17]|uniref:MmyB family transcriptional regulator n=1 Tax=Streptomyces sp. RB17 TaxID=2585197 RepID=UPI00129767E0|nr:hypothetical protein [Streptomyces sp. RB17]
MAYPRLEVGLYPDDPVLTSVVGDLAAGSPDFRSLWAEHQVRDKTAGTKAFHHPIVGDLELSCETLRLADDPAQALVVYAPESGSASADSLRLLLDWTADAPAEGMAGGNSWRPQGRQQVPPPVRLPPSPESPPPEHR